MDRYDLVVIGGGPGGLMAAKTAAQVGLRMVFVERKKNISQIRRACLQLCYLEWVCPDGYLETMSAELSQDHAKITCTGPGCSVDYTGPLKFLQNVIWVSPSGHRVHTMRDENFAFFYDKETLTAGLLAEAETAGVTVLAGTAGLSAENTDEGVLVRVKDDSGEATLAARALVAADGLDSKIVESLGLNRTRQVFIPRFQAAAYDVSGVEPDFPGHETSVVMFKGADGFSMTPFAGDTKYVMGDYDMISRHPKYAAWFKNARIIRKYAVSSRILSAVREPVVGNVVIAGDAGAPAETWIQGAIASGYLAVQAIIRELNGQPGYADYTHWWQKAFYFNDPGFFRRVILGHGLIEQWTDADMDFLCEFFAGQKLVPTLAIARDPEQVREANPDFYRRTTEALARLTKAVQPILDSYPADSLIFPDPDACYGRWRRYTVAR